jgi:glycosyltransferase involved in cell wall biosynthesis
MRGYFQQACVVVPLLHGGGTRRKILEAAACGKPIVSTSLGAEGLNFLDGRDLLLADSATGFAQSVIALLADDKRRNDLSGQARRAAEGYDWENIGSQLRGAARELGPVGARG